MENVVESEQGAEVGDLSRTPGKAQLARRAFVGVTTVIVNRQERFGKSDT